MGKKHTITIDSEEVQGEGSYIIIRPLTIRESRKQKKVVTKLQRKLERLERKLDRLMNKDDDSDKHEAAIEKAEQAIDDAEDEFENAGVLMFSEHVTEWNWTDANGAPLPQPNGSDDSFGDLNTIEFKFIVDQFANSEDTKKN